MFGVAARAPVDLGAWEIRSVVSMRSGYHVRVELELDELGNAETGTAVARVPLTDEEALELGYWLISAARAARKQNRA